ncbi:MAG: hypothetical protein IPJ66_19985 [Bacteroidetes bacterium]|nr:hypothetical protein [Bacteroidota bacterium]
MFLTESTGRFTIQAIQESRPNYIRSITIDSQNRKWICTDNGLCLFDGSNWTIFDILNSSLPVNNMSVLVEENDSTRWLGTINGGLVRMVDTAFTNWSVYANGFPDNTILGLLVDSGGIKWMTCPAGALVAFFNGTWIAYNTGSSNIPTNSLNSSRKVLSKISTWALMIKAW